MPHFSIFKKQILLLTFLLCSSFSHASYILINMDDQQTNHLKAYGIAFLSIENEINVKWLLNYKGGSFLIKSNNFIESIELRNKALASSGNYRKYLIDKESGKKIVHTINPKNGNAYSTKVLGTSVVAQDCITADAYATAFMAMPIEKSKKLIPFLKDIDVMIVYYDKNSDVKLYRTEGFEKLTLN